MCIWRWRQEDVNVVAFDWGKFAAVDDFALAKGSSSIVAAHLANLILQLEKQSQDEGEGIARPRECQNDISQRNDLHFHA